MDTDFVFPLSPFRHVFHSFRLFYFRFPFIAFLPYFLFAFVPYSPFSFLLVSIFCLFFSFLFLSFFPLFEILDFLLPPLSFFSL